MRPLPLAGWAASALGLAAAALSQAAPGPAEARNPAKSSVQPGYIVLEGVKVDVLTDEKLAYRIEALLGQMNEETREIEMEKPSVSVYDDAQQVKDQATGFRGRVWPVTLKVKDETTGVEEETTKYDWSLEGGVSLVAADGAEVTAMKMAYSSEKQMIYSRSGVEYRLPTGKGGTFIGDAEEFEVEIDPASQKASKWRLGGRVNLIAEFEQ